MLLREQGLYNDLSPKLREKIVKKVEGFGKSVRYKFDISNENPDPQKYGGKVIWPNQYILDPATFYIQDNLEDRPGKSKTKRIGMVLEADPEKGTPTKFQKIKIDGKYAGVLKLELQEIPEHFDYAVYLELHPKLEGGEFSDKSKRQIFSRIDEKAKAQSERLERSLKTKAYNAAQAMSDTKVVEFADAMLWDSTQEIDVLRNLVEELSQTSPEYFNDMIEGKSVEYRATVKRALDKGAILFDPAERAFLYGNNKTKITVLPSGGDKEPVEQFSDWLEVGGDKANEAYKMIKSLIK